MGEVKGLSQEETRCPLRLRMNPHRRSIVGRIEAHLSGSTTAARISLISRDAPRCGSGGLKSEKLTFIQLAGRGTRIGLIRSAFNITVLLRFGIVRNRHVSEVA